MTPAMILAVAAIAAWMILLVLLAWGRADAAWRDDRCVICRTDTPIAGTDLCERCLAKSLDQRKFNG